MKTRFKYKEDVKSRSDLLTLLSEACELEHGLACSYLYSAFSLKDTLEEGIEQEQLHAIRKWAAQIYYIASQEMLHLAQVWNLLTAIGGNPYYFRPNFPQGNKYYPLNLPLKLEPFSLQALKRFIFYEWPKHIDPQKFLNENFGYISEDEYYYKTVGDLYDLIKSGFQNIDEKELFIADPNLQIGQETIDFPDIIRVNNRLSAIKAIDMITEQGEGTDAEHDDCHYAMFLEINDQYKTYLQKNPNFQPSRDIISNPIVYDKGYLGSQSGELIINELSRSFADIFDDIYILMLRVLQYVFANGSSEPKTLKKLSRLAINLMVRIIKPLGEKLTFLPAYNDLYFKKIGAAFTMVRHVSLPASSNVAIQVINERLNDIINRLKNLSIGSDYEEKFKSIIFNFDDVKNEFNYN